MLKQPNYSEQRTCIDISSKKMNERPLSICKDGQGHQPLGKCKSKARVTTLDPLGWLLLKNKQKNTTEANKMTSIGEDMKKMDLSALLVVKWYSYRGKQHGSSSKN